MARPRFPRNHPDETTTLIAFLQYLRESTVHRLEGLDEGAARHSPVPTGTSLLWLVKHLTLVEDFWFGHVLQGGEGPDWARGPVHDDDTVEGVIEAYRSAWVRSDAAAVAHPSPDHPAAVPFRGEQVTLRWILTHMLEETGRHAGHADILRELADGTAG